MQICGCYPSQVSGLSVQSGRQLCEGASLAVQVVLLVRVFLPVKPVDHSHRNLTWFGCCCVPCSLSWDLLHTAQQNCPWGHHRWSHPWDFRVLYLLIPLIFTEIFWFPLIIPRFHSVDKPFPRLELLLQPGWWHFQIWAKHLFSRCLATLGWIDSQLIWEPCVPALIPVNGFSEHSSSQLETWLFFGKVIGFDTCRCWQRLFWCCFHCW